MTTLTTISVTQSSVRVAHELAREALRQVHGLAAVAAVAKLRYGPGRTCEPVARVLDRAVAKARSSGLDPSRLTVSSSQVEQGENIVRVRRKAHGKADWITSVTSNVAVELTPLGLYESSRQPTGTAVETEVDADPPRLGDETHPFVPRIRERLFEVIDPDLGINIVDLGFVRKIAVDGRTAVVTMTLTSAACPLTGVMEDQMRTELVGDGKDDLVEDFRIKWEWTPAWTPADISVDGREQLRAIGFTI